MKRQRKLILAVGGLTLAIALITGTGTASAATATASELREVDREVTAVLESVPFEPPPVLVAPAPGTQASARGTHYSCPWIAVTCTLYLSWNHTNDLHKALQGAGPAATATTVGKVLCSLVAVLRPVSAICGLALAGRVNQVKDQAAYAVRSGRCFEMKTSKFMPLTLPGHPPFVVISIGTWDTGDRGTDGRVCK